MNSFLFSINSLLDFKTSRIERRNFKNSTVYTIKVLQHTFQFNNIIKSKNNNIVAFDKKNSTLQK